jgi:hypothetical protein
MFINTQLYDMSKVREQEYLDAAERRQHGPRRSDSRLVAGIARRLRKRG